MEEHISVAEMKSHFSEYVAKVAYTHRKFIITKRNKPLAALVDLKIFTQAGRKEELHGLATIIGKWKHFDEIAGHVGKAYKNRTQDRLRDVSL